MLLAVAHDAALARSTSAPALLGVGIGLAFASLANLIVEAVPPEQTGVATGMNTVMRTLGGSVGGQIGASVIAGTVAGAALPTEAGFTGAFALAGRRLPARRLRRRRAAPGARAGAGPGRRLAPRVGRARSPRCGVLALPDRAAGRSSGQCRRQTETGRAPRVYRLDLTTGSASPSAGCTAPIRFQQSRVRARRRSELPRRPALAPLSSSEVSARCGVG